MLLSCSVAGCDSPAEQWSHQWPHYQCLNVWVCKVPKYLGNFLHGLSGIVRIPHKPSKGIPSRLRANNIVFLVLFTQEIETDLNLSVFWSRTWMHTCSYLEVFITFMQHASDSSSHRCSAHTQLPAPFLFQLMWLFWVAVSVLQSIMLLAPTSSSLFWKQNPSIAAVLSNVQVRNIIFPMSALQIWLSNVESDWCLIKGWVQHPLMFFCAASSILWFT